MDIKVGDMVMVRGWFDPEEVLGVAERAIYFGRRTTYRGMFQIHGKARPEDVRLIEVH